MYPMITMHVARLARFRWSRSTQLKTCGPSHRHTASYRSHAVGRKNWLFIGSLRAGERNASLMSLVASALRMDLDGGMSLESVLTTCLEGRPRPWSCSPIGGPQRIRQAVRAYREKERRDKADMAVAQAARRRVRAELRKGKLYVRRAGFVGCVPMGLLGSADRAPYWATCV